MMAAMGQVFEKGHKVPVSGVFDLVRTILLV